MFEGMVDCLLMGIMGGFIGSSIIMTVAYFHFRTIYREYMDAKFDAIEMIAYKKLIKDVNEIKQNIKDLNLEYYYRETNPKN